MQCETINSHVKSFLSTKILFLKISFSKIFFPFYLIFILFNNNNNNKISKNFVMNSVHEQCSKRDSVTVLSPKTVQVHSVHTQPSQHAQAVRTMAVSWPPSRPCRSAAREPLPAVPRAMPPARLRARAGRLHA